MNKLFKKIASSHIISKFNLLDTYFVIKFLATWVCKMHTEKLLT